FPGWLRTWGLPDHRRSTNISVSRSPPMPKTRPPRPVTPPPTELRRQIIDDFQAMRIPLRLEQLDAVLGRAETEGMSHLEFLRALINEQANGRRQRSLAHRIHVAGFAQSKTLADF